MQDNNHRPPPPVPTINIPDFKVIFRRFVLRYWYLYIILPIVGIVIAFLILRYEVPIYRIESKLLLKSQATNSEINEQAIYQGMDIPVISKNLQNEIQILRSSSLMERVIDSLNLDVRIFQLGRVQNTETYRNSPVRLDSVNISRSFKALEFYVRPVSEDIFLFGENLDEMKEQVFGLPFETNMGRFTFSFNGATLHINKDFLIQLTNKRILANQLASKFFIQPSGSSDLLRLSFTDEIASRGVDFLDMATKIYEHDAIEYLNAVNRNTIDWVERRIDEVQTELDQIEDAEERYLLTEDLPVSLEVATQKALEEEKQLTNDLSTLRAERAVLQDFRSTMAEMLDQNSPLPEGLLMKWPEFEEHVSEINNLIGQRESKLLSGTEINPIIDELRLKILQFKGDLYTDIRVRLRNVVDEIREKEARLKEVGSNIYKTPRREREIRNIDRQKMSKEATYKLLLQQREQIQLSMAVASSNVRVVEEPRSVGVTRRNPYMLYAMSSGFGLIICLFIISLRELLNDKIHSENEAKNITGLPILGTVPFHKSTDQIVFDHNSQSVIAEMFRLLRTNLQYAMLGKQGGTFLITSTASGEGKTFITINLGLALAAANKKVLVLGLDLRQPKMRSYLDSKGLNGNVGITNYLVGKAQLSDVIRVFPGDERLHYIGSGPIPPNPAELLLTDQMEQIINECKEKYDFLLIDSPPIALVTDAFILNKFSDATLIIVRQQYTRKGMLKYIRDNTLSNKLNNPFIVYNGIKKTDQYGYRYGEGYYTKN